MTVKKEKIQITLPISLVQKIEEDIRSKFTSKSLWFEQIVSAYFQELEGKKTDKKKKLIELDI